MQPPRLKLRTLIVLVTLATLAVGGATLWRRAHEFRKAASREAQQENAARDRETYALSGFSKLQADLKRYQEEIANDPSDAFARRAAQVDQRTSDLFASMAESSAEAAEYHARRRAAFLRCARYPWLSPDEPRPK